MTLPAGSTSLRHHSVPVFGEKPACPPLKWVAVEDPIKAKAINEKRPEAARECGRCGRAKLLEEAFRAQVYGYRKGKPDGLATQLGWLHVHFRPAKTAFGWRTPGSGELAKGWPDVTLVHPRVGRLIFAELKGDEGKVEPEQEHVLSILRSIPGAEVYVWTPDDLDEIARILTP